MFASISFHITAAVVTRLTDRATSPEEAHLVVQAEAAERYLGAPTQTLAEALPDLRRRRQDPRAAQARWRGGALRAHQSGLQKLNRTRRSAIQLASCCLLLGRPL